MLRKIIQTLLLSMMMLAVTPGCDISGNDIVDVTPEVEVIELVDVPDEEATITAKQRVIVQSAEAEVVQVVEAEVVPIVEAEVEIVEEPEFNISEDEIDLIALVTMAEAEGECEEGQRLVIDTILNRVESEHFPDTVYDVIYQPDHFSSMWNGRVDVCYVKEDIRQLVREELISRTNTEVLFFHANRYGNYGTPAFSVGNHYFSTW